MKLRVSTAGYLLALASAAAGAVRYNLAVFANPRGFEYVPFLAYALAVGVVCSTIHVFARDGLRGLVAMRGRWLQGLLYGLLMAAGTLSHFVALEYLNETVVASLSQTSILLTIALAVWLLGERFTGMEWVGAGIICVGVFLFRPWEIHNLRGFLILMAGVLGGSLATIGAKRWVQGVPPRVLMLWRNTVALAVVGTYTLLHYERPTITLATGAACVATGIMGPYLHGLFFLQALERIDAAKASLMNRVQPAIVFLLSWWLLDRLPGVAERWSALLLVLGCGALALSRPKPGPKS